MGSEVQSVANTLLCHWWESSTAKLGQALEGRQFLAVEDAALPPPHLGASFLSQHQQGQLIWPQWKWPLWPGSLSSQMSELSGLGHLGVFVGLYLYNRLFLGRQPDTKLAARREEVSPLPGGTTWPTAHRNDWHKGIVYFTKSWKKVPPESSQEEEDSPNNNSSASASHLQCLQFIKLFRRHSLI